MYITSPKPTEPVHELFNLSTKIVNYESRKMIEHVKDFNSIMEKFLTFLEENDSYFIVNINKYIDPILISISHILNLFYQHLDYTKNITEYLQWLLNCIIRLCETLQKISFYLCIKDNKNTSYATLDNCIYSSFQKLCDKKLYQELLKSYSSYSGKKPLTKLMIKDSMSLLDKNINKYIKQKMNKKLQKMNKKLSELKFVNDNIDNFGYPVSDLYTKSSEYTFEKSESDDSKLRRFKSQHVKTDEKNQENQVMDDHFKIRKQIIDYFIEKKNELEAKGFQFRRSDPDYLIISISYLAKYTIQLTIHNNKDYDTHELDSKKRHNKIHIKVIGRQSQYPLSYIYIKYLLKYDEENNIILYKNKRNRSNKGLKLKGWEKKIQILEEYLYDGLKKYIEHINEVNKYISSKKKQEKRTEEPHELIDKFIKLKQEIQNDNKFGDQFKKIIRQKVINDEEVKLPPEYKEVYSKIYEIIEKKLQKIPSSINKRNLLKKFKLYDEPIDIYNNLFEK